MNETINHNNNFSGRLHNEVLKRWIGLFLAKRGRAPNDSFWSMIQRNSQPSHGFYIPNVSTSIKNGSFWNQAAKGQGRYHDSRSVTASCWSTIQRSSQPSHGGSVQNEMRAFNIRREKVKVGLMFEYLSKYVTHSCWRRFGAIFDWTCFSHLKSGR